MKCISGRTLAMSFEVIQMSNVHLAHSSSHRDKFLRKWKLKWCVEFEEYAFTFKEGP